MARSVHNRIDLTGQRFGRLLVISHAKTRGKIAFWLCACDCGTEKVVNGGSLKSGHSISCGCFQKETTASRNFKHGLRPRGSRNKAYQVWNSMMARCYCKTSKSYKDYGAKGIRVCDEWHDAEKFVEWYMANKPPKGRYSMDRHPDRAGPYAPENVRFASDAEQVRNRSMTIWVTINGDRLCLKDAVAKYGAVSYSRAKVRIRLLGYTPEDAVTKKDQRRIYL
jgi:hypothetical protein